MKARFLLLVVLSTLLSVPIFPADSSKKKQSPSPTEKAPAESGYWLTNSSGIRHNSKCKYYKNSKGRFCTKDEGRACKICGG